MQEATPGSGSPVLMGLAETAAADYRRRAQYPPWSTPINDSGEDPLVRDREVSPNITRGPKGEEPSLVTFPDQISFEAPDRVVLYAYLSVNGTPVRASSIDGEIRDPHGIVLVRLQYSDDGHDGDPQGGDAIYTVQVDPAGDVEGRLNGSYAVRVHAVTADGDERFGTTGFLFSNPDAQLSGRYVDRIVDGNLEIGAEVEVSAAGRFHLAASLYTQDGRPLAWAQNALQLDPGVHTIPLSFFGRIFRQRADGGPYVLRFVGLSTTTEMPNAKNRLVENAYVTQAYGVDVFSDRPFDDPNLLDAANRLQGGAAPR